MFQLSARRFLYFIGLFPFFLVWVLSAAAQPDKPNILLILADDLGYEKLGCYGGIETNTPNLDRMASEGTLFERAYASAVCTPSRMSLYTGSYAVRHQQLGVLPVHQGTKEKVDFENQFISYASVLRDAGYQTSVTGKWQMGALEFYPEHCRDAGFESWCVWQIWHEGAKTTRYWNPTLNRDGEILAEAKQNRFGPDVLTDYVIERMRMAKEAEQPFLIHHNMMLPHTPVVETPADRAEGMGKSQDRMIHYLDAQVGKLLAAVEELGLADNTVIFFVGDNGTEAPRPRRTKAGKVTGGKWKLNDAGTHVPLIVQATGRVPSGKRVDDLVQLADFFPTLCELASVEIPTAANPDGRSFLAPMTGTGSGLREWVSVAYRNDFFVFDGHWRLHHKRTQLIDCRELPVEKKANMQSEVAQAAKARLLPFLKSLRDLRSF